jgi:hypothetical protein
MTGRSIIVEKTTFFVSASHSIGKGVSGLRAGYRPVSSRTVGAGLRCVFAKHSVLCMSEVMQVVIHRYDELSRNMGPFPRGVEVLATVLAC